MYDYIFIFFFHPDLLYGFLLWHWFWFYWVEGRMACVAMDGWWLLQRNSQLCISALTKRFNRLVFGSLEVRLNPLFFNS